jgi:hypothetical protein
MVNFVEKLKARLRFYKDLPFRAERIQMALGRIELQQRLALGSNNIRDHEFQVFSQWGEDGIIQFLIRKIDIPSKVFVEFGVGDYTESNTRFLLQHDNWSGLVLEGSPKYVSAIQADGICLRHNLDVVHAFVDKDNINDLIQDNGIRGDIGLLSVDIDGNDYWVWEAITCITPCIVICEYNSLFGPHRKVTVPYDKAFVRSRAHYSCLYYGASIAALDHLAKQKGYTLVGGNSAGNNVFFVRDDLLGDLAACSPAQAYVQAQFRESRDPTGRPTWLDFSHRLAQVAEMSLWDVENGVVVKVKDL